ncbi:MAG: S-ribosylhomocysteine lyase [Clostridia bacterium]|nr:S-ribosylhomocysteine lyase [Clostridia bacterium]
MKRIASFEVDHRYITPGIYISRIDDDITTYDLRTRRPNCGDFMSDSIMHTFEHLFATYVRNSDIGNKVIYFGPMGCATGFYLLLRDANHKETLNIVISVLEQIVNHKGDVFGNSEIECGNYKSLRLEAAVGEAKSYLAVLKAKEDTDFKYPTERG